MPPAVVALLTVLSSPAAGQDVAGTITRPGLKPYSLAVYETGNKLFVTDGTTGHLLVYDAGSLALLAELTIDGGAGGGCMVVDEARGKLYLSTFPGGNHVAVIDAVNNTVLRYIEVNTCVAGKDEALGQVYGIVGNKMLVVINVVSDATSNVALSAAGITTGLGVNPITHEVFIGYITGNSLDIVNGTTLVRTTVPGVNGRNIAVNWIENKVYGSKADFSGHWIHDRDTGNTIQVASQGDNADLVFNPAGNRVYSNVEVNGRCAIIDGATDTLFDLPMKSGLVAVRESTGHVYFVGTRTIGILDDVTQLLEHIPIANPSPSAALAQAIAINQTTGRVFVVNDADALARVTVVQDTEQMTRPPVVVGSRGSFDNLVLDPVARSVVDVWGAAHPGHGLAVRPGGGRAYEATFDRFSFDGVVKIFGGGETSGSRTMLGFFATGGNDPTVPVVSPDSQRLYVTNSASANVGVIDLATNTVLTTVPVGNTPWGAAITPDGTKVYVANRGSGTVSPISTASHTAGTPIAVGGSPWGIAVNPSGKKAYVTNSASGTVSVIDTSSDSVIGTITVEATPRWLAFTPDGRHLYVGNHASGTVSIIDTGADIVSYTAAVENPEGIGALPDGSEVWVVSSNVSGASSIAVIDAVTYVPTTFALPANSIESIPLAVADPTSRVAGRVTSGGVPLAGATIRALQEGIEAGTAATNASGDYAVFNLMPGTYDVEVSSPGCTSQTVLDRTVGPGRIGLAHFSVVCGSDPAVTVKAPNGGEVVFTGTSYRIDWTASHTGPISLFDVFYSIDGGAFNPVPGCSGVGGALRSCTWNAPGPATNRGRVRVVAHAGGRTGADVSDGDFRIVAGAGSITVDWPNKAVDVGIGSGQQIKWRHNLGTASFVDIHLSRDGGATYPEVIATAVPNTGASAGEYNWRVAGPAAAAARVRVTWTNGPTSDASNANFKLAAAFIKVSKPSATTNWGIGTRQKQGWTTNLGPLDRVDVLLSVNGGGTFPDVLAGNQVASAKSVTVTTPDRPTTMGRIKVVWTNPPAGFAAQGINGKNFTIAAPFIAVTSPSTTDVWIVNTGRTVEWSHNLGTLENVKIELSTDGGAAYPFLVIGSTKSDGKHPVTVQSAWGTPPTATARIRVTWVRSVGIVGVSSAFRIQQ